MKLKTKLRDAAQRFLVRTDAPVSPISIVVPARNAEGTIGRTLDSVLAQTSAAWEIVVVDDGSTDGTRAIVEAELSNHPIRIVDGPQLGVSAARNAGTDAARFDHVLYLDADDWIAENFVELMGGALAADPTKAGVRCIWAYETPDGRTQAWDDLDLSDLFAVSARRCPFAVHACVIDRKLVQSVGGFDTTLVIGEDWDLWQRVARAGAELTFVPKVLAFYYLRADSVMHRNLEHMQSGLLDVSQRGNRPDPRVPNPVDRYRDGVPADPTRNLEAETLAGTMAVAVPMDVDLAGLLPPYPPDVTRDVTAETLAGTILEAVPFATCSLLNDWPQLYPRYLDRITEMLEVFANWFGQPGLARESLRILEARIAMSSDITGQSMIGGTALAMIDIAGGVADIACDSGRFEQMVAGVKYGKTWVGFVQLPVIDGGVPADVVADAIAVELGPRLVRQSLTNPRLAFALATQIPKGTTLRSLRRSLLDGPWSRGSGALKYADQFARWSARSATSALLDREPLAPSLTPPEASADQTDDSYGEVYFDDIFSEPDPWLYSGNYEQTKYEQTLEVLGDRHFERGLEMACAEGHFTVQLASRVGELIAADISPTALARAAERCAEHTNIEYRQVDLRDENFPQDLDLLVCSEVLYFVEEDGLRDVARRFAEALTPGGLLIMAHANLVVDDPNSTGFDWGHEFGARRIGEIIATEPNLRHVSTSVSELYRIHLFERADTDASHAPAAEIAIEHAPDLDPHIRRMALWGGVNVAPHDRHDVEAAKDTPILMYHRVSRAGHEILDDYRVTPDALEAQLDYLRTNGYYGITLEEWRWAMVSHQPPPGRAVMLTFDDGYSDFIENAWPILRDYEFASTVFVVPSRVGKTSDWDERFGEPAPLMNWDQLRFLQRNGVDIASHSGHHVAATRLSPTTQLANEHEARARLQKELGRDIRSVAYPFGQHDEVVRATFRHAGYDLGFTTEWGHATVWDDPMAIPRINVGMTADAGFFEACLGKRSPMNPLGRAALRARQLRSSNN